MSFNIHKIYKFFCYTFIFFLFYKFCTSIYLMRGERERRRRNCPKHESERERERSEPPCSLLGDYPLQPQALPGIGLVIPTSNGWHLQSLYPSRMSTLNSHPLRRNPGESLELTYALIPHHGTQVLPKPPNHIYDTNIHPVYSITKQAVSI